MIGVDVLRDRPESNSLLTFHVLEDLEIGHVIKGRVSTMG